MRSDQGTKYRGQTSSSKSWKATENVSGVDAVQIQKRRQKVIIIIPFIKCFSSRNAGNAGREDCNFI